VVVQEVEGRRCRQSPRSGAVVRGVPRGAGPGTDLGLQERRLWWGRVGDGDGDGDWAWEGGRVGREGERRYGDGCQRRGPERGETPGARGWSGPTRLFGPRRFRVAYATSAVEGVGPQSNRSAEDVVHPTTARRQQACPGPSHVQPLEWEPGALGEGTHAP